MTDCFGLLRELRRPYVDPEAIKSRFIELSAPLHPDHVHLESPAEKQKANASFAELNRAHQTLRDPVARLRHLLELETGRAPADVEEVPRENVELFFQVAQQCRQTDAFLEEKRRALSPMMKAELFSAGLIWLDSLQSLQITLRSRVEALEKDLQSLNPAWSAAPAPGDPARMRELPLKRLEELYRSASFLGRSLRQIDDRIVHLTV